MTVLQTAQAIIAAGNQDAPHVSVESYKVASALLRAVEVIRPFVAFAEAVDGTQTCAVRDEDSIYRFNDTPITMGMLRQACAFLASVEGDK